MSRKFDVERGLKMFEKHLNTNDMLRLNARDQLSMYAPEDERVKNYMTFLENSLN